MFKNTLQAGRKLLICTVAAYGIAVGNVWAAGVAEREYQQGENVVADIPAGNFRISDDGTEVISVTDGLVWSRCLVGQVYTAGDDEGGGVCTGAATEFTNWQAALNAVTDEQKTEGWRVANIKELMRIIDNRYIFPAIDRKVFLFAKGLEYKQENSNALFLRSGSSPYLWSSTPKRHKTTRIKGFSEVMTKEESKVATEEAGKAYERVFALDMSDGNVVAAYRGGESRGERETTQYAQPDPDHMERARYVLLVKTYKP